MILSGMPGVSGLGSFVLGRAYTAVPLPAPEGQYSIDFTTIQKHTCVLRPKTPIALITKINRKDALYDPGTLISENNIPQT